MKSCRIHYPYNNFYEFCCCQIISCIESIIASLQKSLHVGLSSWHFVHMSALHKIHLQTPLQCPAIFPHLKHLQIGLACLPQSQHFIFIYKILLIYFNFNFRDHLLRLSFCFFPIIPCKAPCLMSLFLLYVCVIRRLLTNIWVSINTYKSSTVGNSRGKRI